MSITGNHGSSSIPGPSDATHAGQALRSDLELEGRHAAGSRVGGSRRGGSILVGLAGLAGLCVPVCIAAATFGGSMVGAPRSLRAADDSAHDQDGDGLHDLLESGLSIAADRVDTDYDGWNDAEELARRSLPHVTCSVPEPQAVSAGAQAYVKDGKLHFAIGVYRQSGSMANLELELGVFFGGRWVPLPTSTYADKMTISAIPTQGIGELLLLTDVILPEAPLTRTGAMSMWAIVKIDDQIVAADAIDLVLRGKTPLQMITPEEASPAAQALLGQGLLYRPLGGAQVPPAWNSGEICFQSLDTVGSHGAVVTQEVVSASCLSGWDGYCDGGSCASSVGTTVDVIDPAALIGG